MELHVEQPGGVVGALQEGADADEVKGFVLQHGADGDAAREVRAVFDPLEERGRVAGEQAFAQQAADSSQVWFMVSQTSVVKAPRTARAFSRAARRQLRMDEGLSSSATMNSMTLRPSISACLRA